MLEPVLKKSKGFDYICLNIKDEAQSIELVCLGRKDKMRLPMSEPTRNRIEKRFGHDIDWGVLEERIGKLKGLQY